MAKKVFITGIIISLILSLHADGLKATSSRPAIELDGTEINAAAYIDGGNIYLPLRAVGEALGYKIKWSGKDTPISVSMAGENIIIDLQDNKITADDHTFYMSAEYSGGLVSGGAAAGNITYMGADFFSENLALRVRWDGQNDRVTLESVKENKIRIRTVKESSETEEIKITLQYPQIDGLDNRAIQDGINSVFRQAAEEAKTKGLRNAEEMKEVRVSGYTGIPWRCETYFDYRLKYNQNGLLSVVVTDYQYSGGAHGITLQDSYTYNLETGREYSLSGLFRSDVDYVSFISSTIENEINARGLSEIAPFKTINADQNFYLSENGLVFYFQPYEYFPYAAGIQEFHVDFSALQSMLKPDFGQSL